MILVRFFEEDIFIGTLYQDIEGYMSFEGHFSGETAIFTLDVYPARVEFNNTGFIITDRDFDAIGS